MIDYALENEKEFVKKLKELPALEDDPEWKILDSYKTLGS